MRLRSGNLGEGVRLAFDQLLANKFRSGLTILGVIVGVATVMGMSAMIGGVRSSVLQGIEAAGPNNFILARWNFNSVQIGNAGSGPPWGSNPPIDPREARLVERLPAVRRAIVDVDLTVSAVHGPDRLEGVNTSANSDGWEQFSPGGFVSGHNFLESDVRAARPLAVISEPLAEALFGRRDPIGRTIRLNGAPFRVVGVYRIEGNIFADAIKHFIVLPYTAALKYLNAPRDFLGILVVTEPGFSQQQAMDQVTAALRISRGLRPAEENNFSLIRQEEMVETFNRITGVFFLVMLALSSVALMVGGVGVVAIMMISVTERTREIGVRKALGATRREILFQFLVEAATLTTIGAVLGMLIGGSGAFLVQALSPVPASVPLGAVVAALLMAATAGVAFGLWPAWRASRLDPVDALRYE